MYARLALVAALALPATSFGADLDALLKDLKNTKPATRAKAAKAIGEVGADARPALRPLVAAMLDPSPAVRVAAADAVKAIDRETGERALNFLLNPTGYMFEQTAQLGRAAEPLLPIILFYGRTQTFKGKPIPQCKVGAWAMLKAAVSISPRDPDVQAFVLSYIAKPIHEDALLVALEAAPDVSDKAAMRRHVIALLGGKQFSSLATIRTVTLLAGIADGESKDAIRKAIESHRFNTSPGVRKAVDDALAQLR